MKKAMVTVLLIASIFLCSCANKQLPANSSPESNEAKAAKIIDLLPKIKIDWGIEQPAIDPKKWMMMDATKTMH